MASAPTLEVARRDVVAVEHPMVVQDLDKALRTFGRGVETTGRPFRMVSVCGHVLYTSFVDGRECLHGLGCHV